MLKDALRPAWVEINLRHVEYNIKQIRTKVGGDTSIIGIVKADGYGHGAERVSQVLLSAGANALGVATLGEAIALRDAGFSCTIVILGLTPSLYVDTLTQYDLTAVCNSLENAKAIDESSVRAGKKTDVLIAIDTGMGRIGFLPTRENIQEILKISQLQHINMLGLFSHFATSDEADKNYAQMQISAYQSFCELLGQSGMTINCKTMANSAAVMELPSAYFDAVRPGIILYGCYPSSEVDRTQLSLKPAMSVKANIVQLKRVPAGTYISYGRKFQTKRESLIGTLELGYADGYPRALNGEGRVIAGGVYAPVVGNICMDQCMIDVTDVPSIKEGDQVIIMGKDGDLEISADEIAAKTDTINYEILCAFGQRLPKVYIE